MNVSLLREERALKKRPKITWSEEEWENLARIVLPMRMAHPDESLPALVERAMQQFPPERRRKLISNDMCRPLIAKIKVMADRMKTDADEAPKLRQSIEHITANRPDPEKMVAEMPDVEVMRRFSDRVLQNLTPEEVAANYPPHELLSAMGDEEVAAYMAVRMVGLLKAARSPVPSIAPSDSNRNLPIPSRLNVIGVARPPGVAKLPKVVIVGALSGQFANVARHLGKLCRLQHVNCEGYKNVTLPTDADLYVLWTRFIGHDVQSEVLKVCGDRSKMYLHRGGITQMIDAVSKKIVEITGKRNGHCNGRAVNGSH